MHDEKSHKLANHHSESISVPPHTEVLDCLRDGAIIYARGWDLDTFFAGLYPVLKHRFVLVTGESDRTVPYPEHRKLLEDPESSRWTRLNCVWSSVVIHCNNLLAHNKS